MKEGKISLPLVSVVMITYKQADYIAQAINGVLIQEGNFDIELVIADDCSPDNTKEVVDTFFNHKKYSCIKYERHSSNKGIVQNLFWSLQQCKSKYIAICEGDDYWTDPYKLQKQVDFLEANPDYVMTFHDVKVLTKDGKLHDNFLTKLPVSWETAEDLARYGQYIQTNTVLFRNVTQNIPEIFRKYPFGDFVIELYIAQFGKIKYFDEPMSVYRYQVGIHSTLEASEQARTFHYWMLPLWIYFSKTNNKKLASIIMGRIFEYLDTVKDSEDGLLYARYLFGHLNDESFPRFLLGAQQYYKDKIPLKINDGIDRHLKNASIIYLIKVIIYKLRMVLTIKWK